MYQEKMLKQQIFDNGYFRIEKIESIFKVYKKNELKILNKQMLT